MDFINYMLYRLHDTTTYKHSLTPNEVRYVDTLLCQHPELFGDPITHTIQTIMADGVVDIHDVPQMVLLISQLYRSNIIPQLLHDVRMIKLVEFTIDALLDSGILPLVSIQTAVVRRVVDTSLDLLDTNLDLLATKVREGCKQGCRKRVDKVDTCC